MLSTRTAPLPALSSAPPSAAEAHARRNRHANLDALHHTQPAIARDLRSTTLDVSWIYARDGALTARDDSGRWYGGCSVPLLAGREMLKSLLIPGTACFLSPPHAALLQVALEILRPEQAVLAIIPAQDHLAATLHCCDFSSDICARRLWFAAGANWPEHLARILHDHPGLPSPQHFVRVDMLPGDEPRTLAARAQHVFSDVAAARAQQLASLRSHSTRAPAAPHSPPRLCILAPSRFRLWDDAPATLGALMANDPHLECRILDADDPCSSGQLALALAAYDADALLAANQTRADLADLIPPHTPLITWLTTPHVPPFSGCAPRDALLLADPSWLKLARDAGWPARRIRLARWPEPARPVPPAPAGGHMSIIVDTIIVLPDASFDLSSHRLLWEMIAAELPQNPFALGQDPHAYLTTRMRRLDIAEAGLDRSRFINHLILPAYHQALARILIAAGIPLRLHGRAWQDLPEFASRAAGAISSRGDLHRAAHASAALVHVSPAAHAHPIDALARPILRPHAGRTPFIAAARRLTTGAPPPPPAPSSDTFAPRIVRELLEALP